MIRPDGRTGLVIGKFFPPHRGHGYLIRTARMAVNHLVVLVCDEPSQSIPAPLRVAWLREIHPDVQVESVPDILDPDDSQAWAEYCRSFLGYTPDVVFTSEDYGPRFAHFLGCEHVLVDQERAHVPCSGTAIRERPLDHWEFLDPCVRGYYTRRICVVGAESTGTTTLSRALAEHYGADWVAEYGREYAEAKMARPVPGAWTTPEFLHIAKEQLKREEAAARECSGLLLCDTDAFATSIWHERYMGFISPEVDAVGADSSHALYLLTDIDIPFVQDGTRDGEAIRNWMHGRFLRELTDRRLPFAVVSGTHGQRMSASVRLIDTLL